MAAPVPEVFEHNDPWTEAEFLGLPVLILTEPIAVTLGYAALAASARPT